MGDVFRCPRIYKYTNDQITGKHHRDHIIAKTNGQTLGHTAVADPSQRQQRKKAGPDHLKKDPAKDRRHKDAQDLHTHWRDLTKSRQTADAEKQDQINGHFGVKGSVAFSWG